MGVFMGIKFGEGGRHGAQAPPAKVEAEQPRVEPDLNKFVRLERYLKACEESKRLKNELASLEAARVQGIEAHAQRMAVLREEIAELKAELEAKKEKSRQELISRVTILEDRLNAMQAK